MLTGPGPGKRSNLVAEQRRHGVAHKNGRKELLYWGVLLGLAAGFITDMVVTAGGA
jgi:hypothetical protein